MVAEALARLLKILNLRGVHGVDFVYSANKGRNVTDVDEIKKAMSIRRRANATLSDFRTGKTNVLVSTSVVEEGLDVPSCNLVIKFDFPTSYRSYIQSKGRARKAGSQYLLMVEEGDVIKLASYTEYMNVYKMSMEECHSLRKDSFEEEEKEEEEFFTTQSASISGTQAQAMINQYLQKIPVDKFTRLTAVWSISEREISLSKQAALMQGLGCLRQTAAAQYIATAQLPHKTPLHQPVVGSARGSKKQARASAALKVVELLHACGELDDRLRPTRAKKVLTRDMMEEGDCVSEKKSGSGGGRRRWHAQTPPALLTASLEDSSTRYLHRLSLKLEDPHPNPRYRLHQPERDTHSLALLSASRLPDMGPITLFTASGRVTANVTYFECLPDLAGKDTTLAEAFHHYIVTTVISPGPGLSWRGGGGPLVVPVLRGASVPDFDLCSRVMR